MAHRSPLDKLLGYIDELDDILPENDKSILDEVYTLILLDFRVLFEGEPQVKIVLTLFVHVGILFGVLDGSIY